jgi:hypothetical protein
VTRRTRAGAPFLAVTALLVSCGGESGAMHATLIDDACPGRSRLQAR